MRGAAGRIFPALGTARASRGRARDSRIDPDRLGDVLEWDWAEVCDREIEPPFDLPIGVLGKTDRAGLGHALQSRGDVDAVAHQVAVGLLDDVAEMNADAKFNALFGRQAGVALDHTALHFDGATDRVDHAAELDDRAIAGTFDHTTMVESDSRINEVAAKGPQAGERSLLVGARKPAVADDVRDQDRREFSNFAHRAPGRGRLAQKIYSVTESCLIFATTR